MFSDIFWEDPLIYTLCVVMLVAGCEIDVIFVRMKSLPPSLGYFGNAYFRSGQRFWTVVYIYWLRFASVSQRLATCRNGTDKDL